MSTMSNSSNGSVEQTQDIEDLLEDVYFKVTNLMTSFYVGCDLDLDQIYRLVNFVEHWPLKSKIRLRLCEPAACAFIYPSGKITCSGITNYRKALVASRRVARIIQNCGFPCKFLEFKITNVLATAKVNFNINLIKLAEENWFVDYEPEISPGCTWKMKNPKASLKIQANGSITFTAESIDAAKLACKEADELLRKYQVTRPLHRSESVDSDDSLDDWGNLSNATTSSRTGRKGGKRGHNKVKGSAAGRQTKRHKIVAAQIDGVKDKSKARSHEQFEQELMDFDD